MLVTMNITNECNKNVPCNHGHMGKRETAIVISDDLLA